MSTFNQLMLGLLITCIVVGLDILLLGGGETNTIVSWIAAGGFAAFNVYAFGTHGARKAARERGRS